MADEEVIMRYRVIDKANIVITVSKFYVGNKEIAEQQREKDIQEVLKLDSMGNIIYQSVYLGKVKVDEGKITDGIVKTTHPNSRLIAEYPFKNNRINGKSITRYGNGTVASEVIFEDDMPISIKTYNEKGNLIQEATFENGRTISAKMYDEVGNIIFEQ